MDRMGQSLKVFQSTLGNSLIFNRLFLGLN